MRLLVLFLVCSIGLSYAADSYAQKAMISIDVHNQRVEDILKEIEAQSDFDFFFNNKHVDLNRRVSVSADKSNIFSVLKEIFAGTNVKYSVLDKKIILSVEAQSPQQEKKVTVSGTVLDTHGEPVIGASVLEKGVQGNGTITDIDGIFKLSVSSSKAQLDISYIGYQTVIYKDITLQLGEVYNLNVEMSESSELLNEVIVTAAKTKFTAEKTGATTNISSAQITQLPTVNRSISDIARLSPYANGMSFAGGDGRSTNLTIDGANFNNNFGLSSNLPGGGNPISMDAIEEVQVVVAPFDVRQTNFIGGGINAITKSGTNTFRGTAYTYYRNQDMRGNRINGEDLGARSDESKTTYGFTLGGPIIKNKLFFFVNYEKEKTPGEVIKYRAREDGEEAKGMVSRTLKSDMEKVYNHLKDKYGYDAGSYISFPSD